MKNTCLLLAIAFCAGCNKTDHTSAAAPPAISDPVQSKLVELGKDSSSNPVRAPVVFKLTDAAKAKVITAMTSVPNGTHLIVSVDVDDKKYCTGFHYNLDIQAAPAKANYEFVEANGISLAIEKDDVKFLDGTTLDYAILTGREGFVFRNPNAKDALPEELRDQEEAGPMTSAGEGS